MNRRELLKLLGVGAAAPIVGDLTPEAAELEVAREKRQDFDRHLDAAGMCTASDSMELRRRYEGFSASYSLDVRRR